MATKEWNLIDNYTVDDSNHYCVFLDILGYKEKSEMYFAEKYNLYGRFKRSMRHAYALIDLSSILINFSELKTRFFSDSVIISLPETMKDANSLHSLLYFCKVLSAHLSFEGLYVRGGISVGPHKEEIDEEFGFSFLSSIALQKAYILECEKAIYPRILLDPCILPSLSNEARALVAKDENNCFVHFSPQLINIEGENEETVLMEMEEIFEVKSSIKNVKIVDKYNWLLDYYYWTLTLCRNVDLQRFSKFKSERTKRFSLLKPID